MACSTTPDPDVIAGAISALEGRPALIALDGRSGSGKSRLAEDLAARLDAVVVSGDDFYSGGTGLLAIGPAERTALCIDWRRQCDVLERLRSGQAAAFAAFDWEAFDGSHVAKTIDPAPVVILEGTYSARPALRRLLDLRILVTVADDVRAARLLAREGAIGPWERQWHEAEDWYFSRVMPPDRFDIVVESPAA